LTGIFEETPVLWLEDAGVEREFGVGTVAAAEALCWYPHEHSWFADERSPSSDFPCGILDFEGR